MLDFAKLYLAGTSGAPTKGRLCWVLGQRRAARPRLPRARVQGTLTWDTGLQARGEAGHASGTKEAWWPSRGGLQ